MNKRIIILLCLLSSILTKADTLTISNLNSDRFIGKKFEFFSDSSKSLSLQDIMNNTISFKKCGDDVINLGTNYNVNWIKTTVNNTFNIHNLILSISHAIIDEITLYVVHSNGQIDSNFISETTPIQERDYAHQHFLFDINADSGESVTCYLKVVSGDQILLPISIGSANVIIRNTTKADMISGIYFGIMLVMLLYNLFVFFTVKDVSYLHYVHYIFWVALTQATLQGYAHRYIWTNSIWLTQNMVYLTGGIVGIVTIIFVINFLQTAKQTPKLHPFLYLIIGGDVIGILLCLLGYTNESYNALNINAGLGSLFVLYVAYRIYAKGYRPAGFFLISWTIFLLSVCIFAMKDFGIFPYNLYTYHSLEFGSAIEALLLSFALADKINIYRREKEIAQADALRTAQENERIIREQNVTLELKVTERTKELNHTNEELNTTLTHLKETQTQLVESEKMASLGQLTAGIAHEINNPINFVTSNVKPLRRDVDILLDLMTRIETIATSDFSTEDKQKQIKAVKTEYDFDYLKEEVEFLLKGINEGSTRTAEIVKGLRIFSRVDEDDLKKADVNEGLDSTIIIVNNQLNGKIKITRNYGNLPLAECYPGKLNQVFLNMISNAIYAIHKKFEGESGGEIIITTQASENIVSITFADNGIGMSEATQHKLFEPFFTTKPVGEGTGLGLSISYNTIKKHHGTISVKSELDKGTEFKIEIPIIQINP